MNLVKKKGKKKKNEGGKIAHTHEFFFFGFKNPPPQDGLIIKIFKNVLRLLRRQSSVKPTGGKNWDRGKSNYQGGTIFHSLRQSSEGVTGRNDKRRNQSSLDLSNSRRGGSPLNRGCLGRRRGDLTNLPSMSILIYGYRLSGRGRSLNRNSMRGCRGGRCCKLSPTKKALHGVPMGTKNSSAVGRYIERGWGSS